MKFSGHDVVCLFFIFGLAGGQDGGADRWRPRGCDLSSAADAGLWHWGPPHISFWLDYRSNDLKKKKEANSSGVFFVQWFVICTYFVYYVVMIDAVDLFTVTPLDVVKIRLQAQKTPFHQGTKKSLFCYPFDIALLVKLTLPLLSAHS